MKKQFIILFVCFPLLLGISCKNSSKQENTDRRDFNEKSLVALCQLWGFLKYHHPAVAAGNYNWDDELIKQIALIRDAKDEAAWKDLLDAWVDSLPPVALNPDKKLPDLEVKITPDYGELFNPAYFHDQTIRKIKHILENAVILSNHYVATNYKERFSNELAYEEMCFPDLSYRLLALFRHWNIVNYFFPYREQCDQKWSEVLPQMLPEFINALPEEYMLACLKLQTKIDDSHGFFTATSSFHNLYYGFMHPPFLVKFIGNRLVVVKHIVEDRYVQEQIRPGDVITAINGEPVDSIVQRELPYTPASNYTGKLRNISGYILGTGSPSIQLTVFRDNQSFDLRILCYDRRQMNQINQKRMAEREGYRILENNIGYMLPSNCTVEERGSGIKKILTGTRGVVIDLRCYPGDNMSHAFVGNFYQWPHPPATLSTSANVSYPGHFFVNKYKNASKKLKKKENAYDKKIVVIVNEVTQSQAEGHVLNYRLIENVTVIGSTTAGAIGQVTRFCLPGKITMSMSGRGRYYPDHSLLQRKGVKIDEFIEPTIAGIKAGRDELLERAIEIIEECQ